jgi:hypothetical protein
MLQGNQQGSGSATNGSTLGIYIERFQADPMTFADALRRLRKRAGRARPDVATCVKLAR